MKDSRSSRKGLKLFEAGELDGREIFESMRKPVALFAAGFYGLAVGCNMLAARMVDQLVLLLLTFTARW